MNSKRKVIGICGVARSGKDTLARCIKKYLNSRGKSVEIHSLAKPLKNDLAPLVKAKFGLDIHELSDENKNILRPLMVAYGFALRKKSKGKYFTEMADHFIKFHFNIDSIIIPDIRYTEYPEDENVWITKYDSKLIHVSRVLPDGSILQPPNEDERRNDPILAGEADMVVRWGDMSEEECYEFLEKGGFFDLL